PERDDLPERRGQEVAAPLLGARDGDALAPRGAGVAGRGRRLGLPRIARRVHLGGAGVPHVGRSAVKVELPRRDAPDQAADDPSGAADVGVALSIAELEAALDPVVAVIALAFAVQAVAIGVAEGAAVVVVVAAAGVAMTQPVAVQVVARAVAAERGVGRGPP